MNIMGRNMNIETYKSVKAGLYVYCIFHKGESVS